MKEKRKKRKEKKRIKSPDMKQCSLKVSRGVLKNGFGCETGNFDYSLYSMQNHRQTKFVPHVKTKFSVLLSDH